MLGRKKRENVRYFSFFLEETEGKNKKTYNRIRVWEENNNIDELVNYEAFSGVFYEGDLKKSFESCFGHPRFKCKCWDFKTRYDGHMPEPKITYVKTPDAGWKM